MIYYFWFVLAPLLDTSWAVVSHVWGAMALKKGMVSRTCGPGLAQGGVSPCLGPLALQTYRVFSSRAPGDTQKTTI